MTLTTDSRPIVGLMLGDVTGIGAEIAAKMLAMQDLRNVARTVLVGDARHLALGCREAGTEVAFHEVSSVEEIDWARGGFPLLDLGNLAYGGRIVRSVHVSLAEFVVRPQADANRRNAARS